MHLPPEFRLVAACCRWPPSPERDEAVRAAAAESVEWDLVRRIAARHRVEGLVWEALRRTSLSVPDPVAADLRAAAGRIARQSLVLAGESIRLRRLLEEAGIRVLFVKGVTLGALAYNSIGLKMGWDIDLLVPPENVEVAAAILEKIGYVLKIPDLENGRAQLALWHRHWKESVWVKAEGGLYVELHTTLTDHPMLLPGVGPYSPSQEVEVAKGMALPTLTRDELFAYLCVHGASSAWFRLKWIADVAALLGDSPPEEVERLYRRSQELGSGRASAQALLLCQRLFDTAVSSALKAELRSDRVNRWLTTVALRKLAGRSVSTELDERRLGTATIHLMQFGLLRGPKYKLSELWRQLVTPGDRLTVPLPRALAFLYPIVSAARRVAGGRS